MERCPNCGAAGRPGAKFCTICGYRYFDEGESPSLAETAVPDVVEQGNGIGNGNDTDNGQDNGHSVKSDSPVTFWPAGPAEPNVESPAEPPDPAPDLATASASDDASDEVLSTSWPTGPASSWPSPFSPTATSTNEHGNPAAEPDAEQALDEDAAAADALARAEHLVDELRAALTQVRRSTGPDFSGVISDLEVAATPPGALEATDLATLREALLSARERPRDIDTMIDLTRRIDAVVALMIAYDRAIAAIERSLAVLKRDE